MVASSKSPPPVVTTTVSPYSPSRSPARSPFPKREDNSSLGSSTAAASSSCFDYHDDYSLGGGGNGGTNKTPRLSKGGVAKPALQGKTQRLDVLKRRRFMELQQMLAFELRVLAREASKRCRDTAVTNTQQCYTAVFSQQFRVRPVLVPATEQMPGGSSSSEE